MAARPEQRLADEDSERGSDQSLPVSGRGVERVNGGKVGAVTAQIGSLVFREEFSDPDVNLDHERETADHEVVTGHSAVRDKGIEYIVQSLGRRPPKISVTGWITEEQLDTADELVSRNYVAMISGRWTGTAVPQSVSVDYSRVWHDKHGWVFETDIQLVGVSKNVLPDNADIEVDIDASNVQLGFATIGGAGDTVDELEGEGSGDDGELTPFERGIARRNEGDSFEDKDGLDYTDIDFGDSEDSE